MYPWKGNEPRGERIAFKWQRMTGRVGSLRGRRIDVKEHLRATADVLAELKTDEANGLSASEAEARLAQ